MIGADQVVPLSRERMTRTNEEDVLTPVLISVKVCRPRTATAPSAA